LPVLEAIDEHDRPVTLVHEDTAGLRRMAVFDVVVNNADRKGGHVLAMPDGHRYGVDPGLTFHVEHKLRTVLWGWIGEPL
ncbi:phosphatidylinositol kinase, partial [Curtobacterium citreum]|nr:phosphatidylinositol kinase [Curtobacterium citreum]